MSRPLARARAGLLWSLPALTLGVLGTGCEVEDPFDEPWTLRLAPVSTTESIVWADETHARALIYLPGESGDELRSVPLGGGATQPLWMVASPDGREVFALEYAPDPRNESIQPTLVRIPADGRGEPVRIELKAAFPSIEFTPDGERAVLFFGTNGSGEVIENDNQVAILRLEDNDIRDLTLDGFGGAVNAVEFPGHAGVGQEAPIVIDGVERKLAVFLMANECVLLDLANADANQVAVKFGATLPITPRRAVLRPADSAVPDPMLLLVDDAGNSLDLVALRLIKKSTGSAGPLDLSVQVGLLPLASPAGEIALLQQDDVPWVLVTQPVTSTIQLVDLRTSAASTIALPTSVSKIFLREAINEQNQTVPQLVAWRPNGGAIVTLELDTLGQSIGKKPIELAIAGGVVSIHPVDASNLLVDSGDSRIYAVNLDTRSVAPLSTQADFDVAGTAVLDGQLLLAAPGDKWIGVIELPNLDPRGVLLDQPISSMHVLEDADLVVAVHDDPTGAVTVLLADEPKRASARSRWGLLLEGTLPD